MGAADFEAPEARDRGTHASRESTEGLPLPSCPSPGVPRPPPPSPFHPLPSLFRCPPPAPPPRTFSLSPPPPQPLPPFHHPKAFRHRLPLHPLLPPSIGPPPPPPFLPASVCPQPLTGAGGKRKPRPPRLQGSRRLGRFRSLVAPTIMRLLILDGRPGDSQQPFGGRMLRLS